MRLFPRLERGHQWGHQVGPGAWLGQGVHLPFPPA